MEDRLNENALIEQNKEAQRIEVESNQERDASMFFITEVFPFGYKTDIEYSFWYNGSTAARKAEDARFDPL